MSISPKPLTNHSRTRRLLILFAVAILARALTFGNPVVHVDEEFYFFTGHSMWQGAWPFVDVWDRKPVGLFLLYAIPAAFGFPAGIWAYQAMALTSVVATAVVWRFVLGTRFGLLNRALELVGLPAVDWLGNPHASIPAILIFVTWKIFGYNMIVFTAALSAVPQDLMEAARLDGATRWERFRHVTLPAIGPTLLLAAVMSVSGFLQLFAEPYVMTLGGPAQSTVTVLYFMFDEGFKWWNLGQASAVALILFVLTLCVTWVQTRVGRRYEWL